MPITDQKCERTGVHLVSGACGHATQRIAHEGDVLGGCPVCRRPIMWTLLRPYLANDDETDTDVGPSEDA